LQIGQNILQDFNRLLHFRERSGFGTGIRARHAERTGAHRRPARLHR
jgi:hypothetical protein